MHVRCCLPFVGTSERRLAQRLEAYLCSRVVAGLRVCVRTHLEQHMLAGCASLCSCFVYVHVFFCRGGVGRVRRYLDLHSHKERRRKNAACLSLRQPVTIVVATACIFLYSAWRPFHYAPLHAHRRQ